MIEWVYRPDKGDLSMNQFFHYDFTWKQNTIAFDVDPARVEAYDRDSAEYIQYTKAETWIQTDGKIRDAAREIIGSDPIPGCSHEHFFFGAWKI